MEHIRLQPMQPKSGRESTAVTKKSIEELLSEEGLEASAEIVMPATAPSEPEISTEDVRVFDHAQLMPMKGKSGREPTAITHKSIKELLAEEGVDVSETPLMTAAPAPEAVIEEPTKVIDHTRLQPLKGQSRPEPTAITRKSIAELLADEGVDINDMPLMTAAEPTSQKAAPAVAPKVVEAAAPQQPAVKAAPQFEPLEAPEEKPRSFLGRLIGS